MHLSYGKYAREGNVKEAGNGKSCMLKGIKNRKARVPSQIFNCCFSSGVCRTLCEERAHTVINIWKDVGEPMHSPKGQLGTASLK